MEFLLISIALSVGLTMFMRWRARKAQERYEARLREEMARREAAGEDPHDTPMSPFGMLPFGGILEQMLTQGAWTRSYAYDETTGEWVEVMPGDAAQRCEQPPARPDEAASGTQA